MVKFGENLVPTMTSNTTPSGIASASSVASSTYEAWKAFDKKLSAISDTWQTSSGSSSAWLKYEFPNKTLVKGYSLASYDGANETALARYPKDWTFEGSNDDTKWDILDTQTNQTGWSASEKRSFLVSNENEYKYYRINITANNGDSTGYFAIGEFGLHSVEYSMALALKNPRTNQHYSLADNTLIHLPDSSSKNMILYGIEAGKEIQLDVDFDKMTFIQDKSEVLGEGRTFKVNIDMKNEKINKIISK